jgi:ribosomal protein S18 acetylase RimI-like enzyme
MEPIRELAAKDHARAVATIGAAFEADPMFGWMFPLAETRSNLSRAFADVPVRYGLRFGRVTESSGTRAVAIWIPPERPFSVLGMVRCGFFAMPVRIGFGPFLRFMSANDVMGRYHKKHMPQRHWYLFAVGVAPEAQGQGLGSALIREGLGLADAAGHPCYLETSNERNLAYYERFGFRVLGTAPLGKDGPPGWAMRREAQSDGKAE